MVYRIYVEKKQGLTAEADALRNDIVNLLGIKGLTGLRLLNRYDAEQLDKDLFDYCTKTVFSEPSFSAATACMMVSKSLSSRGSTTCVSGSPKRQLYSITFGPSGVSIRPKYRQPLKGQPSAFMAWMVGRKIFSMHSAATSGV